jgi:hypothetical protein
MAMLYEARYAEPLPKRHSGPLCERLLGAWTDPRDAYEAIEWVRVMNGGLSGLRWHARVEAMLGA